MFSGRLNHGRILSLLLLMAGGSFLTSALPARGSSAGDSPSNDLAHSPELPEYASLTLTFSADPELNVPVNLTLELECEFDVPTARVFMAVPSGFSILGASPGGYMTVGGVVSWSNQSITANTPYTFELQGISANPFIGWVDAGLENTTDANAPIHVGTDSVAVEVTNTEATVSQTGEASLLGGGADFDHHARYNEPLMGQLLWAPFPIPGAEATATLWVENTVTYPVSYTGQFILPAGWTLVSGSLSWSEVIGAGATTPHTITVLAPNIDGRWTLRSEVYPAGASPYYLQQVGYFDQGQSFNLHQDWDRFTLGPHPFARTAGGSAVAARPEQTANCPSGSVRIHGQITLSNSPGPASFLTLSMWVKRWTQSGQNWIYDGQTILSQRLTRSGNYDVCFALDGRAEVVYYVYATDSGEFRGRENQPWSAMVFHRVMYDGSPGPWMWVPEERSICEPHCMPNEPGWRQLNTGQASAWCSLAPGGGLDCSWPSEFQLHQDPQRQGNDANHSYLRLAALHARDTRDFMAEPAGPAVGETRRPGWYRNGAGWRATAIGNYTPCGAGCFQCSNLYYMSDNSLRAEGYIAPFAVGNHEFGHMAHWWLNDMNWAGCPPGGGSNFREGWADGFLAPISEFADDVPDGTAGYNELDPIEVIEGARGMARYPAEIFHQSGSMYDFWDAIGVETHPGHTWSDPAVGIWHEAWEMTDQVLTTTVCGFRDTWVQQNRPASGVSVMDHDGVLPCNP